MELFHFCRRTEHDVVANSISHTALDYAWCGEAELSRRELRKLTKQRFRGQSTHRYRSAVVERFIDETNVLYLQGHLPSCLSKQQATRLRRMTRPLARNNPTGVGVVRLRTEMKRTLEQLVAGSFTSHVMDQIPVSI
jgi:hypothetical protein